MEAGYFEQKAGIVTLEYPTFSIPVPENGRYQLHNEIDDCIVCDKCAKICPVDCIDIVPIRLAEEFGKTSDGTAKRIYAAKFDIDMAKCCFCGLCTTVCPTECLTMTNAYDKSVSTVSELNIPFGNMDAIEIKAKEQAWEIAQAAKAEAKAAKPVAQPPNSEAPKETTEETPKPKPGGFKPFGKKPAIPADNQTATETPAIQKPLSEPTVNENKPKAAFKPFAKKLPPPTEPETDKTEPAA